MRDRPDAEGPRLLRVSRQLIGGQPHAASLGFWGPVWRFSQPPPGRVREACLSGVGWRGLWQTQQEGPCQPPIGTWGCHLRSRGLHFACLRPSQDQPVLWLTVGPAWTLPESHKCLQLGVTFARQGSLWASWTLHWHSRTHPGGTG